MPDHCNRVSTFAAKIIPGRQSPRKRIFDNKPALVDVLENRTLLSVVSTELAQEPITIGVPGLKDITFVATSGRKTTLSISGATAAVSFPGPAALTLYQGHAFFPAGQVETISSIVIANALPGRATLKETGAFGTGLFDIGSIVGGDLGGIVAPDVNITANITVSSIKRLILGQVSSAALSLGSSAQTVKIAGPLSGSLTAGSLGTLTASSISYANISTTNAFSKAGLQIVKIDGGSGILDSNIISSGTIGSIKAGFLSGSVITAGVTAPAAAGGTYPSRTLPLNSAAIKSPAGIHAVVIGSGSVLNPGYFSNSVIAAEDIGSLTLAQINGGDGVAAASIGSFNAMGPTGALDRFPFHLGSGQLRTASRVQTALTHLNIPYSSGNNLPEDTVFYNFNLNLLA